MNKKMNKNKEKDGMVVMENNTQDPRVYNPLYFVIPELYTFTEEDMEKVWKYELLDPFKRFIIKEDKELYDMFINTSKLINQEYKDIYLDIENIFEYSFQIYYDMFLEENFDIRSHYYYDEEKEIKIKYGDSMIRTHYIYEILYYVKEIYFKDKSIKQERINITLNYLLKMIKGGIELDAHKNLEIMISFHNFLLEHIIDDYKEFDNYITKPIFINTDKISIGRQYDIEREIYSFDKINNYTTTYNILNKRLNVI